VEGSQGGLEYGSDILLKIITCIVFIISPKALWSKQSGQYSEQKPRPLKLAYSKLDIWVKNALCFKWCTCASAGGGG